MKVRAVTATAKASWLSTTPSKSSVRHRRHPLAAETGRLSTPWTLGDGESWGVLWIVYTLYIHIHYVNIYQRVFWYILVFTWAPGFWLLMDVRALNMQVSWFVSHRLMTIPDFSMSLVTWCIFHLGFLLCLLACGNRKAFNKSSSFTRRSTAMLFLCLFGIGCSKQAKDMYAFAAWNLYLDFPNFFIYLLQLFGDRR